MRVVKRPAKHGSFCCNKEACPDKRIEKANKAPGLHYVLCMASKQEGCTLRQFTPVTFRLPNADGPRNAAPGAIISGATALRAKTFPSPNLVFADRSRGAKAGRPIRQRSLNARRRNRQLKKKRGGEI